MTNVKLSPEELELVGNADFILTKNRIIGKVYALFGELSETFLPHSVKFPAEALAIAPKISKGENYLGLPWVMLDQPRLFSQTDVFAVRTFFWWGNFISIHLQLQGKYKTAYEKNIAQYLSTSFNEWMIGVSADPWQHHFQPDNYVHYSPGMQLPSLPFIKLAKKIPLQQWDNSFDFCVQTFQQFTAMLGTQAMK